LESPRKSKSVCLVESIKGDKEIPLTDRVSKSFNKNTDIGTNYDSSSNDPTSRKLKLNVNNKNSDLLLETICYEDGSVYIGEIYKGIRNGKGKLIFPDNSKYEGMFYNNLYEGMGKLVSENEITYEGMFVKGKKFGKGVQYNKHQTYKFEGEWKDGSKNGHGL
jgi:hypothetical protein